MCRDVTIMIHALQAPKSDEPAETREEDKVRAMVRRDGAVDCSMNNPLVI